MLLRLAYLTVTNAFAALRLLPMSDRDKDAEILALRHQVMVLEWQLDADARVRFTPADRLLLAALLTPLPRAVLRRVRLVIRPHTVLRWHRELVKHQHARTCRPKRRGRSPTVRSIGVLILRLVRENASWGYRRVHGELTMFGLRSLLPRSGKSFSRKVLTQHPSEPPRPGLTSCKSEVRQRTIALDTEAVRLLRRHQQRQHLQGLDTAGWVFTRADGQPIRPDYLTYRFRYLVAASGLPPVRLHDLRHGAASTALARARGPAYGPGTARARQHRADLRHLHLGPARTPHAAAEATARLVLTTARRIGQRLQKRTIQFRRRPTSRPPR